MEPGPGLPPVALDAPLGEAERLGSLGLGHPAEEAALHDPGEPSVEAGEVLDGPVDGEDRLRVARRAGGLRVERHGPHPVPPLLREAGAGVVDEEEAHDARGDAEEVGPVLPGDGGLPGEAEPGLVHEGDGVERLPDAQLPELPPGDRAELVVDERDDRVEGGAVAVAVRVEEARDLPAPVFGHGCAGVYRRLRRGEAQDGVAEARPAPVGCAANVTDRTRDDPRARVDALFSAALDLEPAERGAWLDAACASDGALRRDVEELLRLADEPLAAVDGEAPGLAAFRREALDAAGADEPSEAPGARVGPYRLERELGRGGMGVVWLARRADGAFEQAVAVKLVRRGMATDEVQRRFRRERQILATLAHPGIARLLDGGVTEDGRSFLAMEFVEGEPIDAFCDRARLTVRERVALVARVGRAVQYAHRNLVVHRDLKPSNILVTADGQPRLLDFGIARLLEEDEGGLTRTGLAPMTPDWASPEQRRGEPVTTASDVWQLGVLLHALLAGARPEGAPGADPPRTSVAAARQADLEDVARARRTTPRGLVRELRGDLDTIVSVALRREPERRYATAQQLVDDLERHLEGMPVAARGDSLGYRARRFARRHRVGVAAAIALVLVGVGYAVTVTAQARALARERDRVRTEAAKAAQVRDFLVGLFSGADPSTPEAGTITARELLERGDLRVRRELAGQPEVLAALLQVIGTLYARLGAYDTAVERLEAAVALRASAHGAASSEAEESRLKLADILREKGDYARAEPLLADALRRRRAAHGEESPEVARVLDALGLLHAEKGEYPEAERLLRRAVETFRRVEGPSGEGVLGPLGNLALALRWKGDSAAAEPISRETLELTRKLRGERHLDTAWAMERHGVLLGQRGDVAAAEPLLRSALERARSLLGEAHPDVALMTNNLAKLYSVSGRPGEAEPHLRRALELNRRLFGERHTRVAVNLGNLGDTLSALGRHREAIPLLEEALAIRRERLGDAHPETALSLHYLARAHLGAADPARARALYREAVPLARAAWSADHPFRADVLAGAGEAALAAERPAEAVPLLEEALAIRERILVPGHESTRRTADLLEKATRAAARRPR